MKFYEISSEESHRNKWVEEKKAIQSYLKISLNFTVKLWFLKLNNNSISFIES